MLIIQQKNHGSPWGTDPGDSFRFIMECEDGMEYFIECPGTLHGINEPRFRKMPPPGAGGEFLKDAAALGEFPKDAAATKRISERCRRPAVCTVRLRNGQKNKPNRRFLWTDKGFRGLAPCLTALKDRGRHA